MVARSSRVIRSITRLPLKGDFLFSKESLHMGFYSIITIHHTMNSRTTLISRFLDRNTKLNLSAIRDEQSVYDKHIMDALEVLQFDIIKPDMVVADVGTGGGWPLLALAQSYPDTQFVGIDGRRKKMEAVQTIAIES